jgi:hypothetical protein
METLAGVGVSAAKLQELTPDELTDVTHDPEEEIPYIARWENVGRAEDGTVLREPVYDTITREKWERQEATDDALEQVGAILDGEGETRPSLILTGADHSPTQYGVQVRTEPGRKTEIEDLLPTKVLGKASINGESIREADIPIDGLVKNNNGDVRAIILEQSQTECGDSGGPVFLHYDTGSASMCGLHVGVYENTWYDEDSVATTAETIQDELGGNFITQ